MGCIRRGGAKSHPAEALVVGNQDFRGFGNSRFWGFGGLAGLRVWRFRSSVVQDFGGVGIQRFGGSGFRLQIWEFPQISGTC